MANVLFSLKQVNRYTDVAFAEILVRKGLVIPWWKWSLELNKNCFPVYQSVYGFFFKVDFSLN